ncbi:hypothetical protein K466DRAFT_655693 [Polyporus arcularius HHB13444]|uniref:Uncharacterized protein n=1 Tax=Polyporus arcularius HHB13444 TaxID=1314778 RepID=A0A5C3P0Z2_9APHY|nr:hypothetical protein K466DRAFT_655693 [Polyporus arcularius HHB13444]
MYFTKLLSYSALAVVVLASEDPQIPLQTHLPKHRYVDCTNNIWDGRILECGRLEVPLDWNNPAAGSLTLNYTSLPVKRRTPRKGTVFLHLGHEYLGRISHPENGLNLLFSEGRQIENIVPGYDLVMWTSRDVAVSQRTSCFDSSDEERFRYTGNPYGHRASAEVAFYNATFREKLLREPPWDEEMAWSEAQGPEDVKDILRAQEKMITQCMDSSPDRDMFQYGGTAAGVRDLVALADALDGPGSPLNLWTRHHGSVLASHLLKMFPERVGKVVMDDPVDPVAYQEMTSHEQWAFDIATANNTLALIQQTDLRNGSTGFMKFFGRPLIDDIHFGQIIKFLHSELVEWHTRAEAEYQKVLKKKEHELWLSPDEQDRRTIAFVHARQSEGVSGWRGNRVPWTARVLDGMPLVCGDALQDHVADLSTVRAQAELSIINNMHGAPLIATSAFPPLRYLCHIWPVRAVERVPLRPGGADEQFDLHDKVLVLLHDKDYWNYFSVSDTTARLRWPTASLVDGLHYGDLTLNHDRCSFDIIQAFYDTGTLPEGSRPCPYDGEEPMEPAFGIPDNMW